MKLTTRHKRLWIHDMQYSRSVKLGYNPPTEPKEKTRKRIQRQVEQTFKEHENDSI